jgi:hypothetical protein
MASFDERMSPICAGAERWHDRIWAAGVATMRFLREDPARGRCLLIAEAAGSEAQDRRDRLVRRFAELLDQAPHRDGTQGPRRSRATAEIAAAALYRMLVAKVEAGAIERGEEFLPELTYMATMPFLGAEAAEDSLTVQPLH